MLNNALIVCSYMHLATYVAMFKLTVADASWWSVVDDSHFYNWLLVPFPLLHSLVIL